MYKKKDIRVYLVNFIKVETMSYFIPYQIGMEKWELDTPALLLDLDIMDKNISEMAKYFKTVNADLRPHIKNHMSPIIAHKQIDAGAIGVCCNSIGEAEIMAYSGIKNILISNEIVGRTKINRLMSLCQHSDIMIAVDNPKNVYNLSELALKNGIKLDVLIEINTGYDRCGVEPGKPALSLAIKILESKGLRFKGLNGYTPTNEEDPKKRKEVQEKMLKTNIDTKELLVKNGIEVDIVSAGCTSAYNIAAEYQGITEVQAGTYVFMDSEHLKLTDLENAHLDIALTVLTTVISKPTKDRIIIDAGNKAIANEKSIPKDITGFNLYRLSSEHGRMKINNPIKQLDVGDKIELIPSYCDGTVNLWNKYYGIRNNQLEVVWDIHHFQQ